MSNFAASEGRLGGEFFTPYSIVRLIVEIIEPFHGRVYDPACGSGGMFVQCAKFVEAAQLHPGPRAGRLRHRAQGRHPSAGQDEPRPARLCQATSDWRTATTRTPTTAVGKFDFVMANPPFNVDKVDKDKLAGDPSVPLRLAQARQRQLPLDPAVLRRPQRQRAGPGSSWPTPLPTLATPNVKSADSSSNPERST